MSITIRVQAVPPRQAHMSGQGLGGLARPSQAASDHTRRKQASDLPRPD